MPRNATEVSIGQSASVNFMAVEKALLVFIMSDLLTLGLKGSYIYINKKQKSMLV